MQITIQFFKESIHNRYNKKSGAEEYVWNHIMRKIIKHQLYSYAMFTNRKTDYRDSKFEGLHQYKINVFLSA